jgi:hypothetical protein
MSKANSRFFPSRRLILHGVKHLVKEHEDGHTRTWCQILTAAGALEIDKSTSPAGICQACLQAISVVGDGAAGIVTESDDAASRERSASGIPRVRLKGRIS